MTVGSVIYSPAFTPIGYWTVGVGTLTCTRTLRVVSSPTAPAGSYTALLYGPGGGSISAAIGVGGVISLMGGGYPGASMPLSATVVSPYEWKKSNIGDATATPTFTPPFFDGRYTDPPHYGSPDPGYFSPAAGITALCTGAGPVTGAYVVPSGTIGELSATTSITTPENTGGTDGTVPSVAAPASVVTLFIGPVPVDQLPTTPITITNLNDSSQPVYVGGSQVGTVPANGVLSLDIPQIDNGGYVPVVVGDTPNQSTYKVPVDWWVIPKKTNIVVPYNLYVPPSETTPDSNPPPILESVAGNEGNFQGCVSNPCVIPYLYTYKL